MKFSIKDFPQETGDLITFTEEILNEKLHFLYSGSSNTKNRRRRAKKKSSTKSLGLLLNESVMERPHKHYKKQNLRETLGYYSEQKAC